MAYEFIIEPAALKRRYSVYVVVAKGTEETKLYVGKTGDNREGCNPIISRCGNHFSYNQIHSQVRNKLPAHEDWLYTYVFDHFDAYPEDVEKRRESIDRINEMERWLNILIQKEVKSLEGVEILNPFKNRAYLSKQEQGKRAIFHTKEAEHKLTEIVSRVGEIVRER